MSYTFDKSLSFLPEMIGADLRLVERAKNIRFRIFSKTFKRLLKTFNEKGVDKEVQDGAVKIMCSSFGMFAEDSKMYWLNFGKYIDEEIMDMQIEGVIKKAKISLGEKD